MIIGRDQLQWVYATTAIALASTAAYLAYAVLSANGPRGGSAMGLLFGFAGTGVIVFECLLSLRKKYPASPIGRVSLWLRAHVWLGMLSFLLILFHSGFHWGRGLASLLMWIFATITVSGIVGVALQNYIPTRMMELVRRETIFAQIPHNIIELRKEADERTEFITADLGLEVADAEFQRAGGVKQYFDPSQKAGAAEKIAVFVEQRKNTRQIDVGPEAAEILRSHYLQEIRPFLFAKPQPLSGKLFQTEQTLQAYFNFLRTILPVASHSVLNDLESICEERRQLGVQVRLHHLLHGWLYLHVPLSMAFLVLTLVHAVVSLRY